LVVAGDLHARWLNRSTGDIQLAVDPLMHQACLGAIARGPSMPTVHLLTFVNQGNAPLRLLRAAVEDDATGRFAARLLDEVEWT
jgi:hypothetical protein